MLTIVRHGRTAHNAGGRLLGHLDLALDTTGETQARALVPALGPVDRIIASPLLRTRQTADVISAATGAPVTIDERWIELDYGQLDGMPLVDVPTEVWSAWRADLDFRPPGGETLAELGARVRSACADLVVEAAEHEVVVVTHVSPIKASLCWALDVSDAVAWRAFVAPASITRIGIGPRGPVLHGFNDVTHLGPDATAPR